MAESNNAELVRVMNETGMIPVFYHADVNVALNVLKACYDGGVRIFEFTNRGKNAMDVFQTLVREAKQLPGLYLGIGTILNPHDTAEFIQAGADFIVSPILNPEMSPVCKKYNKLWIPGCATLTEIVNAKNAGAEVIKLFPASVLGPAFVSSVLPVIPGLKLMPTGSVEPEEKQLAAWFRAGVHCVGMSSQLLTKEAIADAKKLTNRIAETLAVIRKVRADIK